MGNNLFLIFNHQITPAQEADARRSLGVEFIVNMPQDLQQIWADIPPSMIGIRSCIEPIMKWLNKQAKEGDFVLIQGDFGACYLMVDFAMEKRLVPVYSTTRREVVEEIGPNGSVKMIHHFSHQIFRRYGY